MQANKLASSPLVGSPFELANLWQALIRGQSVIGDSWYSADECFVALRRRHGSEIGSYLSPRRVEMFQRTLLGHSQKEVAIDQDLAVSTVAFTCSECLRVMGVGCSASRVPTILMMAAHAARGVPLAPAWILQENAAEGQLVLSVPRPDRMLDESLSVAERDITRRLVEGLSHAQIAEQRQTSVRTVANQLASIFRKLKISGRAALMCKLISTNGAQPSARIVALAS